MHGRRRRQVAVRTQQNHPKDVDAAAIDVIGMVVAKPPSTDRGLWTPGHLPVSRWQLPEKKTGTQRKPSLKSFGIHMVTPRSDIHVRARRHQHGEGVGPRAKIVHFLRHGQGFHNLMVETYQSFGVQFETDGSDRSDQNPHRRASEML